MQEGISNSSVIAITQDNDHFLWFGTRDGLNRFDGYNIQIFRKDRGNPNSLLFDDIRLLYFDPLLKTIWAGSTKGLSRFISEKNEFHNYHFNPTKVNDISEYYIQALLRDSKGNLWVGVPDGLYLFNATKDKYKNLLFIRILPLAEILLLLVTIGLINHPGTWNMPLGK